MVLLTTKFFRRRPDAGEISVLPSDLRTLQNGAINLALQSLRAKSVTLQQRHLSWLFVHLILVTTTQIPVAVFIKISTLFLQKKETKRSD
jgi:hypothetical protein